jgi:hypothetical protein
MDTHHQGELPLGLTETQRRVENVVEPEAVDSEIDLGSVGLAEELRESVALTEVISRYELLSADDKSGYIVVADRDTGREFATTVSPRDVTMGELGSASPSPWTSWTRQEHVPELRERMGMTKFYRMKRGDGTVRGSMRMFKTPLLSARWFVKPGTNSAADRKIAEFVQDNLFERLNVSWSRVLEDVLLLTDYGYMPFEKVWAEASFEGGRFVQRLAKLAPRHPMDVQEWVYDSHGGPDGLWMESSRDTPTDPGIWIPIDKLAVFTFEGEAGDMAGVSLLRSAYKHWFYKETLYKIDAIQKERHGIGIPVIKLPLGWSSADKLLAEELGRNLRTNERAHVTLPPGWDLLFAKVEGQMVDSMKSIEHHDKAIMSNGLMPFLNEPTTRDEHDLFYKSTRYVAELISDVFNRHVIRKLVDLNYTMGVGRKYPKLVVRRIGEWEDLRTQSFALRNLVGAGIIEPDDPLEEAQREDLDLPPKDAATARKMITEPAQPEEDEEGTGEASRQRGARAGRSRQQPTPPSGSGSGNSGTDRSGG